MALVFPAFMEELTAFIECNQLQCIMTPAHYLILRIPHPGQTCQMHRAIAYTSDCRNEFLGSEPAVTQDIPGTVSILPCTAEHFYCNRRLFHITLLQPPAVRSILVPAFAELFPAV